MIFDREPVTQLIGFATGICVKTQRITERELKALGITYPQFGVLTAIAEKDGRTQSEIAERLESDANTTMVICDSLEKKGLAERRHDPADRRIWRISMTPQGSRAFAKAMKIVEGLYRPLTQVLSEEEIAKTIPLLERLYRHLKAKDVKPKRGGA